MSGGLSHTTVLLDEAVEALAIKRDGIYVDGTFGRGGHSAQILKRLGTNGKLIAMDNDAPASNRICYVGTDNYQAGKAVGRLVKETMPDGGTVAIFVGQIGNAVAQ